MSFREKGAWIGALTMLVVYGLYFEKIAQAAATGEAGTFHYGPLLAVTVIALVVLQVVLSIVISVAKPREAQAPQDERDRVISLKSAHIAFYVLSTAVVMVCFYAAFFPSSFYITNALLFSLVVSEIVRNASKISYYRAGA